MFSCWGIVPLAEWYWIKITPSGQLVHSLDSSHKRPYELLMLGAYKQPPCPCNPHLSSFRAVISVPAQHSRKPALHTILAALVTPASSPMPSSRISSSTHTPSSEHKSPRCLELFARSSRSGWTSWGNEALYFQNTYRYHVHDTEKTN